MSKVTLPNFTARELKQDLIETLKFNKEYLDAATQALADTIDADIFKQMMNEMEVEDQMSDLNQLIKDVL